MSGHRECEAPANNCTMGPSPGDKRRILHERAMAFAVEPRRDKESAAAVDVIEFLLDSEHFAVEISEVREIFPVRDVVPLPCTPPFILGIMNVRGRIISLIDIKRLLHMPPAIPPYASKAVIIEKDAMEAAFLVDHIVGIRKVGLSDLQPVLPALKGMHQKYLRGITGAFALIDGKRLLSDRDLIIHDEILI